MEELRKQKNKSLVFEVDGYVPSAGEVPIALDQVVRRSYGHYLEDFVPGTVFVHPRGVTLDRGAMLAYATTFMEANPLYLNEAFARRQGYDSLPAAPHMVMNLALSLGVQNDSEKAVANLGYWDVRFLRPVYAGDTLTGKTRVIERKDRGIDKPGIVTVETLAENQDGKVVIQYRRKIMVPRRGTEPVPETSAGDGQAPFPWKDSPKLHVPFAAAEATGLTTRGSVLGAFAPGQIWVHENGRTITDEHMALTYQLMNTHPLHFDRLYSQGLSGAMSGEPIVYGGLVFAWLLGLASRDVSENAVWEMGFHAGFHTQPTVAGDTVYAISRVLSVELLTGEEVAPEVAGLGVVRMQLVGVKNIRAQAALDQFGADLFITEDAKKGLGKEKIPAKIFEIERSLLVRASPA
jgi:2-methylfumaryl-CoA hydratase